MQFFLARFIVYLFLGFIALKASAIQPLIDIFCLQLANTTVTILNIFDESILRTRNIIYRNGIGITVSKDCSALDLIITLCTAILATPTAWYRRLTAVSIAILLVVTMNLVRLMSLIYLRIGFSSETFNMVHEQIWPFLLTVISGILFLYWYTDEKT